MASQPSKVDWPADRVERRKTSALVPYARNARTHTADQIAQLGASIEEWGWTIPVLVDESDMIIAGHGRVLAAQKLGLDEVPVMVARGWTDAQKRAYVIADNKLAENAGWDAGLLGEELAELRGVGYDTELTGIELETLAPTLSPHETTIKRVAVDRVSDRFWLSVTGPLELQAQALSEFKRLAERTPGLAVEIGTVTRDNG